MGHETTVLLFRPLPVKFTAYNTSCYCLKLLGILENSTGKRIYCPRG